MSDGSLNDTTPFYTSISIESFSNTEIGEVTQADKCPICFEDSEVANLPNEPVCIAPNPHNPPPCLSCLFEYFKTALTEYRHVACPICEKDVNFTLLRKVMECNQHTAEFNQYDSRLLEQCLRRDPNAKFCPRPDCPCVTIVPNCKKCPQLTCPRCSIQFCGICQDNLHPNQPCSNSNILTNNTKKCPNCSTHIEKVNDGSCNLILCPICQKKFCWLCGREASELHFWSPSGCTYYGNNRWNIRRTNYCQLCILFTAPLIIFLLTLFALFGIVIGLPILSGFLLNKITWKYKSVEVLVIIIVVTILVILSPIIYILFIILAVPLMYLFFYLIVPIYLCKKGLCCQCRNLRMDQEEIV